MFRSLITQSAALAEELRAHGKGEPPASQLRAIAAKPKHPVTGEPFGGLIFPPEIGGALADSPRRPGLHNSAAMMMRRSPELQGMPETALGMARVADMSPEQRAAFFELLRR